MKELVVTIEESGRAHGLETPDFNLAVLGPKSVKRATSIEFEEATQKWDVIVCGHENDGHPIVSMGFGTYEEARQFEVDWLQRCALGRVPPLSHRGITHAIMVRHRMGARR